MQSLQHTPFHHLKNKDLNCAALGAERLLERNRAEKQANQVPLKNQPLIIFYF